MKIYTGNAAPKTGITSYFSSFIPIAYHFRKFLGHFITLDLLKKIKCLRGELNIEYQIIKRKAISSPSPIISFSFSLLKSEQRKQSSVAGWCNKMSINNVKRERDRT